MWIACLILSVSSVVISAVITVAWNFFEKNRRTRLNIFRALIVGIFFASAFMLLPVYISSEGGAVIPFFMSIFNSMKMFTFGVEFGVIGDALVACDEWLRPIYRLWSAILLVGAPIFTFGFVLSFFKNISAIIKYYSLFFKDIYVFSELNERSLTLAADIKKKYSGVGIVFNGVSEEGEHNSELAERAKCMGAVCFKKEVLSVPYGRHSKSRDINFFAIDGDETENLNKTLGLVELYKNRRNTRIYVFSSKIESELLLTAIDKGEIKVRRVNEVQSLINRVLYERGEIIFENASEADERGERAVRAAVIGMGNHGTEMVKALAWFGQMDGYSIETDAFDRDPLALEKFRALAPELMSEEHNGSRVSEDARYTIRIHSDCDVESFAFASRISEMKGTTYVFISLGDDELNIRTAVNLRMLFERAGAHPIIQAVLNNSRQKKALEGIRNYRGQEYDIEFIGDIESSYTESVMINSELEREALERHLKWGKEEEFWAFEYNYRSSVASAIHMRARIKCGIAGADKPTEALTDEERRSIEILEHRRWNAYMRAEGYVFSGSRDKSSRNDLAKKHHDLVTYAELSPEEQRKDSKVGTK